MLQELLDAICNAYTERYSPLVVNWSIGKRKTMVAALAKWLGRPVADVEEQLTKLVEEKLLTDKPHIGQGCTDTEDDRLGITHQGWLGWTDFDDMWVEDHGYATVEEWLAWDGADNFPEGGFPEAFVENQIWRSISDPWSASMDQ